MSIDEWHQHRWRAFEAQRQNMRDALYGLRTYSAREDEDAETFRHRLARQNLLHELEMGAREDVANDDDPMRSDEVATFRSRFPNRRG